MPYSGASKDTEVPSIVCSLCCTPQHPRNTMPICPKIWASYTSLMLSSFNNSLYFHLPVSNTWETWASASQVCLPAFMSQSIRNYFLCITSGYAALVSKREEQFYFSVSMLQGTQADPICSMSHSFTSQAVSGSFISYLSLYQLKQFRGSAFPNYQVLMLGHYQGLHFHA